MIKILLITGPIYTVIALGYLCVKLGLFAKADLRVLGKLVVNVALPCLLFKSMALSRVQDILNLPYLGAYALGSVMTLGVAWSHARWVRRQSPVRQAITGMGSACSNSGFLGFPIALQLLGPPAGVALALTMLVENLLMLPTTLAMADRADVSMGSGSWRQVTKGLIRSLVTNPMVLAIVLGVVVGLNAWSVPVPLLRAVDMLAAASAPVALFAIGGTLVGLDARAMLRDAVPVVGFKLLLHPLAVGLGLWLLAPALDPALRVAAVVFAAMPMLSIFPVLAQRYRQEEYAAAALVLATLTAFLTITAVLWVVDAGLHWMPVGP